MAGLLSLFLVAGSPALSVAQAARESPAVAGGDDPSFAWRAGHEAGLGADGPQGIGLMGSGSTAPPSYGSAYASSQYYEYISGAVITLDPAERTGRLDVDVVITTGIPSAYGAGEYVNAWLDFNSDGVFQENERIMRQVKWASWVGYQGTLHYSSSFWLPPDYDITAIADAFSPMQGEMGEIRIRIDSRDLAGWSRVVLGYGVSPGPTGSWTWGSVVDQPQTASLEPAHSAARVNFRTLDQSHSELSDVTVTVPVDGAWHTYEIWDGLRHGFVGSWLVQNGQYPVAIEAQFGGFLGLGGIEKHLDTSIRLFDDPMLQVQVVDGHEGNRQGTYLPGHENGLKTTRHSSCAGGSSQPCPSPPGSAEEVTTDATGTINILSIGTDLVATGITAAMKSNVLTTIAGSVISQMLSGAIQSWISAGDPVLAYTHVLWNMDRRSWKPRVADRGLQYIYDNLGDNVTLDNEAVCTVTVAYPPRDAPDQSYFEVPQRGFLSTPWITPLPGIGTIFYIQNLDSLGTYTRERCNYQDPITDLNTALLDQAGYREEILRRYKDGVMGPVVDTRLLQGFGLPEGDGAGLFPAPGPTAGPARAARSADALQPAAPDPGDLAPPAGFEPAAAAAPGPLAVTASGGTPVPDPAPAWGAALLNTAGDSRAEFLAVSAPFTAGAAGTYTFYARLAAADGTALAEALLSADLAAGTYRIPLYFDGRALAAAGQDGPYTVAEFVWLGPEGWGFAIAPYATPAYTAGEFAPPAVAFARATDAEAVAAGPYRTDLRLTAHLSVLAAGTYQVGAVLLDSSDQAVGWASTRQDLTAGKAAVELQVSGWDLAGRVPARVQVYVLDPGAAAAGQGATVSRTDPLPVLPAFAPRPAVLGAGLLATAGEDTDGDGGYDLLQATVPVEWRTAGPTLRLLAAIENADGTMVESQVAEATGGDITVAFVGQAYRDRAQEPRLRATLLLVQTDGSTTRLDERLYPLAEEPARYGRADLARMTGGYAEALSDPDGNGLYDGLGIEVQLQVTEPGEYRLTGDLLDSAGRLIQKTGADATLQPGAQRLTLTFSGDTIRRQRTDGPWQLANLVLWRKTAGRWPVADRVAAAYQTAPHQAARFAPAYAVLSGAFADTPVDTDGDGLYNQLQVTVGLEVASAGSYRVDASLYDSAGTFIQRVQSATAYYGAGSGEATLLFDGTRLHIYDGPYLLRHLQVYRGGYVADQWDAAWATAAYQGAQFQPGLPDLYLSGSDVTVVEHEAGLPWQVRARIRNLGGAPALAVPVRIAGDGTTLLETTLERVAGQVVQVETTWEPATTGSHTLAVAVDPHQTVPDSQYGNQSFSGSFAPAFPSVPREVAAACSAGQVVLSWLQPAEVQNLAGYRVYRAEDPAGPYIQLTGDLVQQPGYTDTGVEAGRTYYYRVAAVTESQPAFEGAWSEPVPARAGDVEPPQIAISTDPAAPDGWGGWFTRPVTVTLAATDAAGVATLEYRLNAGLNTGPWQPYTGPFTLSTDGQYTLEVRATDILGNPATAQLSLNLDQTGPGIQVTDLATGYPSGVPITLDFSAADTTSGLGSVLALLDGRQVAPLQVVTPGAGRHRLRIVATDQAGNQSVITRQFTVRHAVAFQAPLNQSNPGVPLGLLPIRFSATGGDGQFRHDEGVSLVLWRSGDYYPLASFVYGLGSSAIGIDDVAGRYVLDVDLARYGLAPGDEVTVYVYFGGLWHRSTRFTVQ